MGDFEILDSIDEIIYISDVNTHEMIYANKKLKDTINKDLDLSKKTKCYEYLHDSNKPCKYCNCQLIKEEKFNRRIRRYLKNGEYYLLQDSIANIGGRQCRIELAVDISTIGQSFEKLKDSLAVEKKLESCIKKLVSVGSFKEALDSVLDTTLEYFNGDRAYIFELDWENNVFENTFEICKEGITPEIETLKNLPISYIDLWLKVFNNRDIIAIEDVKALKYDKSRKIEYEILSRQNINSLIAVPIKYHDKIQGFLGVDNPSENINDTEFLKNLTFFISNEIQKDKLNKTLENLIYKDMLTEVNNRNAYNKLLENIKKSNYKKKGAVFVDMNGLKYLNDNFGHSFGDKKLKDLAEILKNNFDEKNVFRISGDEFAILCLDVKEDEFIEKCKKLSKQLKIEKQGLGSIGYIWDNNNIHIEDLVQQAEQLMYLDKEKHYIENSIFFRDDQPTYSNQIACEIKNREFIVYLQPKYSFNTEMVYGAEALVRMVGEDGRIIGPNGFIPILEKENLISNVDYFVFETVCKLLVKWEKEGHRKLVVSSNFSRITVGEEKFVEKITDICKRTGVNCEQLVLELTESSNMVNVDKLTDIMNKLKDIGLKFALDDMGTEYATLEMLELEALDMAKIDRSMIMKICNGERPKTIISQIITLCHKLGLDCVAEGVETQQQMDLLRKIGCDRIQGFFIGKPMAINEFEKRYIH